MPFSTQGRLEKDNMDGIIPMTTRVTAFITLFTIFTCWIQMTFEIDPSSYPASWTCYFSVGKCLYLSEFATTQRKATCWCREKGGNILKLDSQADVDTVREIMAAANKNTGYYIGANDRRKENSFVWEDGTSASFIPWHVWGYSSEPDNYNNEEQCVALTNHLWWEANPTYFADYDALDVNCEMDIHFICQKNFDKEIYKTRLWGKVSENIHYPTEVLETVNSPSKIHCALLCTQNCQCLTMSYEKVETTCYLYGNYFNRITSGFSSTGYINYE